MKLTFVVLGLSILLLALAGSGSAQTSVSELFERTSPSVVLVVATDSSGKPIARGTGFCVAPGKVVTNKHVIEKATSILIKTNSDETFEAFKKSVDQTGDLALLESIELGNNVKPLRVAKASPNIGDKVVVIGNPLGLEGSLSDGIVSSFRNSASLGKLIQITAPISHGSSGSPVINLNGDVVGIATLSLEEGQNLNFAISSERLLSLWSRELKVSNETTPSGGNRDIAFYMIDRVLKPAPDEEHDEWLVYGSTNLVDFLVNPAKGNRNGETVRIWVQQKDRTDGEILNYSRLEIDCAAKAYKVVSSLEYFELGNDPDSLSGKRKISPDTRQYPDAKFIDPAPDTVGEQLVHYACYLYKPFKVPSPKRQPARKIVGPMKRR